jgi:hypothetical protein
VEKSLSIGVSMKVPTTSVRTREPRSWFRRDGLWGLILILFVILAYTTVWKAGFVWDDEIILTANPCIVGPLGLREIWTTSAADICPLTLTTFWMEHALWGIEPAAISCWSGIRGIPARAVWASSRRLPRKPVSSRSLNYNRRGMSIRARQESFFCTVFGKRNQRRVNSSASIRFINVAEWSG